MKKIKVFLAIFIAIIAFSACEQKAEQPLQPQPPVTYHAIISGQTYTDHEAQTSPLFSCATGKPNGHLKYKGSKEVTKQLPDQRITLIPDAPVPVGPVLAPVPVMMNNGFAACCCGLPLWLALLLLFLIVMLLAFLAWLVSEILRKMKEKPDPKKEEPKVVAPAPIPAPAATATSTAASEKEWMDHHKDIVDSLGKTGGITTIMKTAEGFLFQTNVNRPQVTEVTIENAEIEKEEEKAQPVNKVPVVRISFKY